MSRIKPRTHGKESVRHITRLERENHETLFAYAQFLEESADYIVNQLVQTVLAKDKEFVAWRAQHTESFVPSNAPQTRNRRRTANLPVRAPQSAARAVAAPPVTADNRE
jgi:hypothetical protein